jgi:four helix bundle protein
MASGLRDLRVWQEAVATAAEVVKVSRKAARPETRPLTELVVRCAANLAVTIARAHARETLLAQRDALRPALESAAALETGLAIARHAELLPAPACAELAHRAASVARLLTGYIGYLDRVVEADGRGVPAVASPDGAR